MQRRAQRDRDGRRRPPGTAEGRRGAGPVPGPDRGGEPQAQRIRPPRPRRRGPGGVGRGPCRGGRARSRGSRRRSLRGEGPRGLRGHAHLVRIPPVQGTPARHRGFCPRGPAAVGRCGAGRQDGRARVRDHLLHVDQGVGHDPQPVGSRDDARGIERRFGGRRRGRYGPVLHRERRWRLDPDPGRVQRPGRAQAQLRPDPPSPLRSLRDSGLRRPHHDRGGRRP